MSETVLHYSIIFLIAVISFCLIKIVFSVKFDFNYVEWRKLKDERQKRKVQSLCPHAEYTLDQSGQPYVKSWFISVPGWLGYMCQRCGAQRFHIDEVNQNLSRWAEDFEGWKKARKKHVKAVKKWIL